MKKKTIGEEISEFWDEWESKHSELQEITAGKTLPELFTLLRYQLNTGESLGGTICSHIVNVIEKSGGRVITKENFRTISITYKSVWVDRKVPEYCGKRTLFLHFWKNPLVEDFHYIVI